MTHRSLLITGSKYLEYISTVRTTNNNQTKMLIIGNNGCSWTEETVQQRIFKQNGTRII
jgi:ribosomal protein L30E